MTSKFVTTALSVCVVFAAAFASKVSSAADIDVLVATVPGTTVNATALAGQLELELIAVMAASGMPTRKFNFRPFLANVSYTVGPNAEKDDAREDIIDDLVLDLARDTAALTLNLGTNSYDIVVVFVDGLKDSDGTNICGSADLLHEINTDPGDGAPVVPDGIGDTKFLAMISETCNASLADAMAHEIGHIMGGNHQVNPDSPTTPCPDPGNNPKNYDCFPSYPVSYNHPMMYYDALGNVTASTLMSSSASHPGSPQYSAGNGLPPMIDGSSQGLPSGNAAADMRQLINLTWDSVAAYRPLPQSDPWMPDCQAFMDRVCGLPAGLPNLFTTVSASLPGYTITNVDIDYRNGLTGPWNDLYEGEYSCPGMIASITRKFRLLVETTQGLSLCEIVVDSDSLPVPNCGGGGPGGGGFE